MKRFVLRKNKLWEEINKLVNKSEFKEMLQLLTVEKVPVSRILINV